MCCVALWFDNITINETEFRRNLVLTDTINLLFKGGVPLRLLRTMQFASWIAFALLLVASAQGESVIALWSAATS